MFFRRRDLIGDEFSDLLVVVRSRHRSEGCFEGSDFVRRLLPQGGFFAQTGSTKGLSVRLSVEGCLFVRKQVCEVVDRLLHSATDVNL